MTIGYLHVGSTTHGVTRYGRMLADAARKHLDADVLAVDVELDGAMSANERQLRMAAARLAAADVVHLQYNERVWGNAQSAAYVRTFVEARSGPLVVTLHDVRRGYGWRGIGQRVWAKRTTDPIDTTPEDEGSDSSGAGEWMASLRRAARYVWKEWQNTRATQLLTRRADRVLVCTREEARRLRGMVSPDALVVIPHFVEGRSMDESIEAAKATLGLIGRRVCTVLGFIHRKKGHALVVEAMAQLPEDVEVVFAGRPARGSEEFVRALQARAEALNVRDRLHVTGYLSEEELDHYLAATDLALCPFKQVSASGSLSTWIATGRPILASEQPQIAEYNAMASGAIATFSPYTPATLAAAICAQLDGANEAGRRARTRLREKLSLPRIIQQHAAVYRQVGARSTGLSTDYQPE